MVCEQAADFAHFLPYKSQLLCIAPNDHTLDLLHKDCVPFNSVVARDRRSHVLGLDVQHTDTAGRVLRRIELLQDGVDEPRILCQRARVRLCG